MAKQYLPKKLTYTMKPVSYYKGREQTYLKHFFLERYLERVAYVIGYNQREFVYVDGFSGPWKSQNEEFYDTSFMIAIKKLREVRYGLARAGKHPSIRCLFVEKDRHAFEALQRSIDSVSDIEVRALHGKFESVIPDIVRFVGHSFSLVFIDPTGWTGFGMRMIEPVIQHEPGEVLINFMFDHINRFLAHPSHEVEASIDQVFGGSGWYHATRLGSEREDTIIEIYRNRLRTTGKFRHVTSTRILKPLSDRSYFYLVYGTRHVKGLLEFRGVEKSFVAEQERVRFDVKQTHRVEHTGQQELFDSAGLPRPLSFEEERRAQLRRTRTTLRGLLQSKARVGYDEVLSELLERPLVWESDVKQIIADMVRAGDLAVDGLKPRERTIKRRQGHALVSKFSAPRGDSTGRRHRHDNLSMRAVTGGGQLARAGSRVS